MLLYGRRSLVCTPQRPGCSDKLSAAERHTPFTAERGVAAVGSTLYVYCAGVSGKARPPMWKEMVGRLARLQLGSCLLPVGTPGPSGAAVAPVSATMLLNTEVGTVIRGAPVSRNARHAGGDPAEHPGSARPGTLALTRSSATCQPFAAVGTLRAAEDTGRQSRPGVFHKD